MADKETKLSIVIRTVDKATAGIREVNERIAKITAPVRALGASLAGLSREAGLPRLVDGLRGVGGAMRDLLGKLTVVGAATGAAVFAVKAMVDEFDDLGDRAERLGVSVDFLAQLRHAAERTGGTVEQLDSSIQTFAQNLGQARAGTGRMAAFLSKVSPALLRQLKGAKDNEAAFNLLARAMVKLEDPAKRIALAQKVGFDPALVTLLGKGAAGIKELRDEFEKLAGSQKEAAEAAGPVDDELKRLKAATQGVKAALVTGLAPALGLLVEKLKTFFAENREKIAAWALDFGTKLPARIEKFSKSFLGALDDIKKFVEDLGGIKTVALVVAGVIAGPLVASLASLSAALLATPLGRLLAIVGAVTALTSVSAKEVNEKIQRGEVDVKRLPAGASLVARAAQEIATETRIKVDFANAPRGTRVTADPRSTADVDLSVGYQLGAGL